MLPKREKTSTMLQIDVYSHSRMNSSSNGAVIEPKVSVHSWQL